jgi:hypothetical protein
LVNGKLPDMPTTFPLVKVLTGQSGPAVEWLMESFGLDLSLVSQLGGHSFPRTHRGKERFPGMTITYALMEKWSDTTLRLLREEEGGEGRIAVSQLSAAAPHTVLPSCCVVSYCVL